MINPTHGLSPYLVHNLTNVNLAQNITVLKADNYVYLRTAFNSTQDIVQKLFVGTSDVAYSPGYTTHLIAKTAADTAFAYEADTIIHVNPDDAAPLFLTTSYIGAAHGLNNVRIVTSNNHGKTVEDVGSQWADTNNRKFTIIKIVDINTLWILGNPANANYPKWYIYSVITGNLTHFSGATHTDTITITTQVNSQLIPAIKNKTLTVKLNGTNTLTTNGIYKANNVVISEYYDVVNPISAIWYLQSQVGSSTQPAINTGDTMFSQETKYTYYDNAACLVYNKFTPKQEMDFGYYGFIQSSPLYVSGSLSKMKHYIPKALPITLGATSYDFRTVKDVTSFPVRAEITAPYWQDANSPPERAIQYLSNSSDALQVGFAMGYLKGKGVETNLKNSTTETYRLETTKKQYPRAFNIVAYLNINTVYEGYCFRNYFAASELATGKIGQYFVKEGTDVYLYLDYTGVIADTVAIPTAYRGKTITLVEKSANVSYSDTVTGATLAVDVVEATPQTGFLILKLT